MQTAVEEAFFFFLFTIPNPYVHALFTTKRKVIQGRNHHQKNSEEGGQTETRTVVCTTARGGPASCTLVLGLQRDDLSTVRPKGKQAEQRMAIQDVGKGNLNLIVLHTQRMLGCCRSGKN